MDWGTVWVTNAVLCMHQAVSTLFPRQVIQLYKSYGMPKQNAAGQSSSQSGHACVYLQGRDQERELRKKVACDLKRGVMGRAPCCKNCIVPLPCVLSVGWRAEAWRVSAGSSPGIPWCFLASLQGTRKPECS
jgi:hypothetical protein